MNSNNNIVFTCLAILALFATSTATTTTAKLPRWQKPTELDTNNDDQFRDNKESWAWACASDPSTPPSPKPNPPPVPGLPSIVLPPGVGALLPPGLGDLLPPGLIGGPPPPEMGGGNFPASSTVRVTAEESKSISKCMMNHHPKAKDCYGQISKSWVTGRFHLDSQCCKMVVLMDDGCNDVVYSNFKSDFFPRLLQYSCHLKNKN